MECGSDTMPRDLNDYLPTFVVSFDSPAASWPTRRGFPFHVSPEMQKCLTWMLKCIAYLR